MAFYGFMWRIAENTYKKYLRDNKTVFVEGESNHVPGPKVKICDSMGRILEYYDPWTQYPPIFDYGQTLHR